MPFPFPRPRAELHLALLLALLLPATPPATAAPDQAEMARRLNNPVFDYEQGRMYYYGKGTINGRPVAQDYARALDLFRKAASNGSADATFFVGFMYYQGVGVEKDLQQARQWLQKAADQRNPHAALLLGHMFQAGEGVPKDNRKAAEWYRPEAGYGFDMAENKLGSVYLEGLDATPEQGMGGRTLAVALDATTGQPEISLHFRHSTAPEDLAAAEKWLRRAADKGNPDAMYSLATLYYQSGGDDLVKRQRMLALLRKLYTQNKPEAAVLLGILYFNGDRADQDRAEATRLFRHARQQGSEDAGFILDQLARLAPPVMRPATGG